MTQRVGSRSLLESSLDETKRLLSEGRVASRCKFDFDTGQRLGLYTQYVFQVKMDFHEKSHVSINDTVVNSFFIDFDENRLEFREILMWFVEIVYIFLELDEEVGFKQKEKK